MPNHDSIHLAKHAHRSLRRRIHAVLRMAHRCLGMRNKRLGIGALGKGTCSAIMLSGAALSGLLAASSAQAGSGIFINDGTDSGCSYVNDGGGNYGGALSGNVSIGNSSFAGGHSSTANCTSSDATTQTNRVLFYGPSSGNGSTSLSLGGTLAVNSGRIFLGGANSNNMAIGNTNTNASGGAGSAGSSAIAIGPDANAIAGSAGSAIAFGGGAFAKSNTNAGDTLAFGASAQSTGQDSVAIGAQSIANNTDAIAIGGQGSAGGTTTSSGIGAVSIGIGAQATGNAAYAMGYGVRANGENAIAVGRSSNALAQNAMAYGVSSNASGVDAIAMGSNSVATSTNAIAFGVSSKANGTNAVAFGGGSVANAANAIAFGQSANAAQANAIAFGGSAIANGNSAIAFGQAANANAANATAIGTNSKAAGANGVAVGLNSISGATGQNVAIGVGANANAATATGGAVAIGLAQKAIGDGAVAIGDPNIANGTGAVALGANNTAAGDTLGVTAGNGAVALGNANFAVGQGSVSLGNQSNAAAAGALAFGDKAMGAAANAVALGSGSNAGNANDVALGAGSTTAAVVNTPSGTINGTSYTYAGNAANSTVSVGSSGKERTITNVAAGRITATSTDAVNGSQLFATNQAVNAVGTSVTTIGNNVNNLGNSTASTIGGGTTFNTSTGTLSGFSQTVNPVSNTGAVGAAAAQTTVAGALTQLNTNTSNLANVAVKYDAPGGSKITLGATGGAGAPAGGVTITNLANGAVTAASTDGVNGSQLFAVQQTANKGWNANTAAVAGSTGSVSGSALTNIAPGGTVTYQAGNNIAITQTGSTIAIATSMTPTFTTVTAGNSTLNTTGLTITGGPSVTTSGINAASKVITNVANGVAATDGVNFGQLQAVGNNANAGWNLSTGGNTAGKSNVAPGGTVDLSNTDGNIVIAHSGPNATFNLASNLTVASSVTVGNSKLDTTGLTITGGPSVTTAGINAASKSITNVANGVAATDAVNLSQLNTVSTSVTNLGNNVNNLGNSTASTIGGGTTFNTATGTLSGFSQGIKAVDAKGNAAAAASNFTTVAGALTQLDTNTTNLANAAVKYDDPAVKNKITLGNAGTPVTITNVANGALTAASTDAVNGSQLLAVQQTANKGWNLSTNKGATTSNIAPGGTVDLNNSDGNVVITQSGPNATFNLASNLNIASSITVGNSKLDTTGLTITGGPSVTTTGINAASKAITNVAAGTNATDAVNLSQLNTVSTSVTNLGNNVNNLGNSTASTIGGGTTFNTATGTLSGFSQGIKAVDAKGNAAAAASNFTTVAGALTQLDTNTTNLANAAVKYDDPALKNKITLGNAGTPVTIGNLANGVAANDAVNVSQLQAVGNNANAGWNLSTGGNTAGKSNVAPGGTVDLSNTDGNVVIAHNGPNATFNLASNLNIASSIAVGNSKLDTTGLTITGGPSVTTAGINAASKAITNVAAGTNATDAVNLSQLNTVSTSVTNLGNNVNNLGNSTASTIGGGTTFNTATGTLSGFSQGIKAVDAKGNAAATASNYTTVAGALTQLDSNTTNLANAAVKYDDPAVKDRITLGNAGTPVTIGNVANGIAANDAVNVSQLDAVSQTANKGWNLSTNKGATTSKVAPGDTVDLSNTDGNVVIGQSGPNATFDLASNVKIANSLSVGAVTINTTSVVVGASKLDATGLTINGGPSVTTAGVDGGGKKITNVANGLVTSTSTDAVNGSQLFAVVGNATANAVQYDDATKTKITLGGAGATQPTQITNLANGAVAAGSTDAVNGSQLYDVQQTANKGWNLTANGANSSNVAPGGTVDLNNTDGNLAITKTGNAVTFNLSKNVAVDSVTAGNSKLDTNGLTITGGPSVTTAGINAASKAITNVAAGTNATDAVNLSQLNTVSTSVTNLGNNVNNLGNSTASTIGGGSTYDPNTGTLSGFNQTVTAVDNKGNAGAASKYDTVGGALTQLDTNTTNLANAAVKYDDPAVKDKITLGGIGAGDLTLITNLAKGTIGATSSDAVNGSQLYAVSNSVANNLGGGSTVNADGTVSAPNYVIGGNSYNNVGNALGAVDTSVTALQTDALQWNKTLGAYDASHGSGSPQKISNVANGVAANDAVNVSQLQAVGNNANAGWNLSTGGNTAGKSNVGPGGTVDLSNTDGNITIAHNGPNATFDLASNVKIANSLSVGTVTIDTSSVVVGASKLDAAGLTINGGPSVTTAGIDAASKKITNVADGTNATDAVNFGQLNTVATSVTNLGNNVNNLGTTTASTLGGGAGYDPATGKIASFSQNVTAVDGKGNVGTTTGYTTVAGALTQLDTNTTNLANAAVKYDDPATKTQITLGGTSATQPTKITNLANGTIAAGSTDAVSGQQLFGLSNSVANNLGGGSTVNPDGSVSAPTYNIAGNTYNNVGNALNAINTSITGGGIKYFHANSTGPDSQAIGTDSIAIGPGAVASKFGPGSIAMGLNSTSYGQNSIAIGTGTTVGGPDGVALGHGAYTGDTQTTALGANANAAQSGATAVGFGSQANVGATAVGLQANATGQSSVSVGQYSTASGAGSLAFGTFAGASGDYGISAGWAASAGGVQSVAIGRNASAGGQNAIALGMNSRANNADDVALGSGSTTAAVVNTPTGVINGVTYNYAGNAANSTVSVGSAGNERTITNVAAGQVTQTSTDAVNGSQLFATNQAVNSVATSVTNLGNNVNNLGTTTASTLGGGAGYDPATGKIANFSQNVTAVDGKGNVGTTTGYTTVAGALTQLDTNTTNLANAAVKYDDPAVKDRITLGNAGTPVTIGNVANGIAANDAVNVSQLQAVGNNANAGWNLSTGGDTAGKSNVGPGGTVDLSNTDGNIVIAHNGPNATFDLASTVKIANSLSVGTVTIDTSSVVVGASKLDATGLTITGGPSVTTAGIDAGSKAITNVAAGTNATDAVNVGQLQAVGNSANNLGNSTASTLGGGASYDPATGTLSGFNQNVTAVDGKGNVGTTTGYTTVAGALTQLDTNTTNLANAAVKYDDPAVKDRITLGNAGTPVTIGNVANGIAANDAVNVSQLDAVNQTANKGWNLSTNNGGTTANVAPGGTVDLNNTDGNIVISQSGSNATFNLAKAITLDSITAGGNTLDATGLTVGNTTVTTDGLTIAGGPSVTVDGIDAGGKKITNVAKGDVSSTSTDTVNGSQLFSLGNSVASGLGGGSSFDPSSGTVVTSLNYGGGTFTSVQSVLDKIGGSINGGGIKYFHANSTDPDSIASGDGAVGIGPNSVASGDKSLAAGNGAIASETSSLALGNGAQSNGKNAIAAGTQAKASADNAIATGNAAEASGTSSVATGNGAKSSGNDSIATGTGAEASGNNSMASGTGAKASADGAIASGNGAEASGTDSIATGTGSKATQANSVAMGAGADTSGGQAGDVALGSGSTTSAVVQTKSGTVNGTTYNYAGGAPTSTVSVGSAGNERTVTNVAAGQVTATSTDAVNGSQLYATNQEVGKVGQQVANLAENAVQYDAGSNKGSITLGGTGGTTITNLANGTVAAGSTDAVNGQQLYEVQQQANKGWNLSTNGEAASNVAPGATVDLSSADNNMVISQTGTQVKFALANDVKIANSLSVGGDGGPTIDKNGMTIGQTQITSNGLSFAGGGPTIGASGIDAGGKKITGVAPATLSAASTDAVNGSQLYQTNQNVQNLTNLVNNFGGNIANLQSQVSNNLKEARQGISQAMAASALRYDDRPGKVSAAAGMAVYHRQVGLAAGLGWTSEDAKWRANVAGTYSAGGRKPDFGVMGGLSYTFN